MYQAQQSFLGYYCEALYEGFEKGGNVTGKGLYINDE
jgi:hypothetical protein